MVNLIDQKDFVKDVAINPDELDELWMIQPQIFEKYAENCSDLMLYRDDFKIELESTRSKVMRKIIDNPKDYGLKKTTDAIVVAALNEVEEYTNVLKKYNQINNDYNKAKERKNALIQKKESMQNLVTLHGQSYFAGPTVPRKLETGNRFLSEKSSAKSVDIRKKYNK